MVIQSTCNSVLTDFEKVVLFDFEDGDCAKPKIMLQDSDDFDIESWMVDTLAGTEFPIICCINSCRVNMDALGERTSHERNTTLHDLA